MNTTQQRKEVVRQLFEQGLNKRNFDLAKELVSDEYIGLQGKNGGAGFLEPVLPLIKAFPDIQWNLVDLIGEGDKVMFHWKWQGTHRDTWITLPASGKTIASEGMAVMTVKEGKVISSRVLTDRLGFLQAMDVLPTDINELYKKAQTQLQR